MGAENGLAVLCSLGQAAGHPQGFPTVLLVWKAPPEAGCRVLMWREEGYLVKGKGVRFQFFESKGFHVSMREETTHHAA